MYSSYILTSFLQYSRSPGKLSQYLDSEYLLAGGRISTKVTCGEQNRVERDLQASRAQCPSRTREETYAQYPSVCTTSLGGRYSALGFGSTISIFKLDNDQTFVVNRIECEATVLAISIDASSGRLALAALLERQVGIYIDLLSNRTNAQPSSP